MTDREQLEMYMDFLWLYEKDCRHYGLFFEYRWAWVERLVIFLASREID